MKNVSYFTEKAKQTFWPPKYNPRDTAKLSKKRSLSLSLSLSLSWPTLARCLCMSSLLGHRALAATGPMAARTPHLSSAAQQRTAEEAHAERAR